MLIVIQYHKLFHVLLQNNYKGNFWLNKLSKTEIVNLWDISMVIVHTSICQHVSLTTAKKPRCVVLLLIFKVFKHLSKSCLSLT